MEEIKITSKNREKMQLRYHTPEEAQAIGIKNSEKIAKKLIKRGDSIEDIAELTELPLKRVQQMAKRLLK
ncbi:MAG: hypothetical protein FWD23_14530 [Oscillospiraceae bacterium]|nr:hypothetical protein [Oscillospiraceae bacterium]